VTGVQTCALPILVGYQMALQHHSGGGLGGYAYEDEGLFKVCVDAYAVQPRAILEPFFRSVWETCGLDYPSLPQYPG